MTRIVRILLLTLATAFLPLSASAALFSSMFVFGDSLSDSGNNAAVIDAAAYPLPPGTLRTGTPISSPSFIPTLPYASNRYSNGPVWVEGLAADLGLSAQPAVLGGTNFAFGGARSGPLGSPFPYSLLDQKQLFLSGTGGVAPSTALYVISGGGNDARDAFELAAGGGDPTALFAAYASDIGTIITDLESAGAHDILLLNVPDISKTPAIRAYGPSGMALASWVAGAMNTALNSMLGTLSPAMMDGIHLLDTFSLVDDVVLHPAKYSMNDVTSACAASQACIDNPDTTFFWDGIHPTAAGHAILAEVALHTVPEPGTVLLIAIAALALLAFRPRQASSRAGARA